MTIDPVPHEDREEQRAAATPDDDTDEVAPEPEVVAADELEAPDADLVEQQHEVPLDEDEEAKEE